MIKHAKKQSASKCRCFIKHAITPSERKEASQQLDYFRRVGDSQGIMVALAQLSGCQSQEVSRD